MKKRSWLFCAASILALTLPAAAQPVTVVVNGQPMNFSQPPIERTGRVFVPLRGIFEQLGASVVYSNGQINATAHGRTVSLNIGSTQAMVAGQPATLDVAPFIVGSTTFVPLRFISQALGASVNWNDQTSTVTINGGGRPPMEMRPPQPPPPPPARVAYLVSRWPTGSMYDAGNVIRFTFNRPVVTDSLRIWLDGNRLPNRVRQSGPASYAMDIDVPLPSGTASRARDGHDGQRRPIRCCLGIRNRRALVTGAASGLAAGIAADLARDAFARVAITYRTTPPDATISAIEAAGARGSAVSLEFLGDADTIERGLAEIVARHGPFDTLVHGVGPLVAGRFERATLDDYREAFDGNVRSAVLASRAVLPAMREASFGRIVFFAMLGSAETRPFRSLALYAAAKSALVGFARALAIEEAARNITVNVVAVGDIREKTLTREQARQRTADNPRGRPGSYEDVADAVRFFIAEERDFITGAVLDVNGGLQRAAE